VTDTRRNSLCISDKKC